MHIAIVRRHCSLKKAGAERYCVNLFRGLQRLGHQVTVVGESIDDELKSEVDFIPVAPGGLTSWGKNRTFAAKAAQAARGRGFDIVHGLSRVEGLDTYRLTDPMQTHWVKVWYRNPLSQWLQQRNPRHRAIFDLEQKLFQPQGVRRIIVQSKLDARLLTEYFRVDESRIRRIVNGVDTSVFNLAARDDSRSVREELERQFESGGTSDTNAVALQVESAARNDHSGSRPGSSNTQSMSAPLLVFASMDFRRKGLDSLLAAMSRLKEREARLLVLGDGDIVGYRRKAVALGLKQRVLFAGRQASIQRFYGAADLFVLPTVYEPFPNVNLEAMACGTPVVTTATAGGADIIEEGRNGHIIPDAWSVEALSERIDHHLALPSSKRQMMTSHCWEIASQLKIEDNARQVASVFEEVLREKQAA